MSIWTHDIRVFRVSAAANNTLSSPPSRLVAMIQVRVDMGNDQRKNAELYAVAALKIQMITMQMA